jgi:hypothetical protein
LRLEQILETLIWFVLDASVGELKAFEKEANSGPLRESINSDPESVYTWRSLYYGQLYGLVRLSRAKILRANMLAHEVRTGKVYECYCRECAALFIGDFDAWEYGGGGNVGWAHHHDDQSWHVGYWLTKKEALARFPQLHSQDQAGTEVQTALKSGVAPGPWNQGGSVGPGVSEG